jgi:release factor glutamine methyltransferase
VVDLGTGSGAIALSLKHGEAGAHIAATDVSPDALAVARGNAERLGLDVEFVSGPWWAPLDGRRFHVVVSNPPYIAGDDHHLAALAHEPRLALTPEGDGLDALRDIVAGAPAHLEPGGWLLLEHGHDQAEAVAGLLVDRGFVDVGTRVDLGGNARCTGGRCIGASSG